MNNSGSLFIENEGSDIMAKSFADSLNALYTAQTSTMSLRSVSTLAAEEESWTLNRKYDTTDEFNLGKRYEDEHISFVDEKKNVKVNDYQVNLTQEENSQYIPFEMNRYYDGIDLMDEGMEISFFFENIEGGYGSRKAINVRYNDTKIRVGFLVPKEATLIAGKLKFEIHVIGADPFGNRYVWKTKTNDELTILESLQGNGDYIIDPGFAEDVLDEVKQAASDAKYYSSQTKTYLDNAKTFNEQTTTTVNSALTQMDKKIADVEATITENVITELSAVFYTKEETEEYVSQMLGTLVNSDGEEITVEAYVKQEIANADIDNKLTAYAKTEEVKSMIGYTGVAEDGSPITVVDYINSAVEAVDISDELGNLVDSEGNKLTVEEYVLQKVDEVDISEQLNNYYTKDVADDKFATHSDVETSVGAVSNNIVTNAENILKLQNNIGEIQASLDALEGDNKNLIIQYDEIGSVLHLYEKDENGDIIISDGEEEIKVKEISSTIIIGAGGGGNSLVSTIKLNLRQDGESSSTILFGSDAYLNYNLSTRKARETQDENGQDVTVYEEAVIAGDITFTLYRDNVYLTHFTVTKTSPEVQSGSVDISDYIVLGKQVFTITASYVEKLGSDGESITIRSSSDWAVEAVNLGITGLPDQFDATWESTPKYGSTAFSYTPIGALEKTIYFKIDNSEPETVVTLLNGTALTYTIPRQSHGTHTLQVWCEANIGGTIISTEPYTYVLMFVENGNNTPIIRVKAPETLEQYSSTNIYYNVFDPLNGVIDLVTIYDEEGVTLSLKENITSAEQKYEFRPSVVKDKIITIKYKEITESVSIKVTKFPYEINSITGNLMIDFVPTGRTNSDVDYNVFKNNAYTVERDDSTGEEIEKEIPMTWSFSDNFDWINGGWKTDENGDTYFCVKSGTSVDINYNLFGTDGVIAKKDANGEYTIAGSGKEFKLIFKTTNVAKANTTWLQCVDIADKKSLGIRMEAQNAYIDSGLGTLEIPYVDDDIIEFDMNIIPVTRFLDSGEPNLKVKTIPMVITYEDGTPVRPQVISSVSTSFKQDNPKPITIGSEYCDVHIYRMKIYERHLEDKEIITNFIADARSGAEMAKRYLKNDIYPIEDKQKITPESVAAACPDLKVYVLSAPHFTNDKGDKVSNTTIKQIHNTGTKEKPEYDATENWIATGVTHNGQGTSSNEYGYSGRNLEFNLKKATITLNDNTTVVKEIQLSPTSYPTNYLNFKINIASSENANNALHQKRYDRYLPYTSVASLIDDRKKNSMEFFNCVVFIQETDEDISTHREFSDTNVHFYGIGNIGDSKKTDNTRVNDADDPNEFCVEIMDWNRYLSSFPMDTMMSTLYTDYIDGKEVQVLRFEDLLINENLGENGILYEKDNRGNYYHSLDTSVDKNKTYYIDVLENDDFSEDYTYGFRYVQQEWKKEDYADYKERNEEFQRPLREKWIEFYRFVTRDLTTNGVEDAEKVKAWKSEFSDWFILDAALYYYLYTLRYTMVDNRAKNTFWHWAKHYLTLEEALEKGIKVYDENEQLITDTTNPPSKFYDVNGNEIKNINEDAAQINNGYRMDFWDYDNDTALGIDNAGQLEIPFGVEEEDVDTAGIPYFRAYDSLVFTRIAKYFVEELENAWHNTEINPIGKVFDADNFINEFDAWQNEFPEELWRLDYERKYKRTYVGGTGNEWDNALPQSNKSDIVSTRFLTEMMNGRKKYQRRCFERNQEIYMSSKFKGEINLGDTITLRGTGRPTNKVVAPNFTLNLVPFSKMYINLYSATDKIYYHKKCEAGIPCDPIPYPETTLDFIYIRGASQIQSLGDLSPMYLQTAELTSGAKLKNITLGNATNGYANDSLKTLQIGAGNKLLEELDIRNLSNLSSTVLPVSNIPSLKRVYAQGSNISEAVFANNGLLEEAYLPSTITRLELRNLYYLKTIELESYENLLHLVVMNCSSMMNERVFDIINKAQDLKTVRVTNIDWHLNNSAVLDRLYNLIKTEESPEVVLSGKVYVDEMGQKKFEDYRKMWPTLDITCPNVVPQFPITFLNDDGEIIEVQYVSLNTLPVDPITREENPKDVPTKQPTDKYEYIYNGWDREFEVVGENNLSYVYRATYVSKIRKYKVEYITNINNQKKELYSAEGDYGTVVEYQGELPTYIAGESSNDFYLFERWDKIGYVDGNKTVTAIFDTCHYINGYFDGKEFNDLRPVEKYALLRLNVNGILDISEIVENMDALTFRMSNDYTFYDEENNDISKTFIDNETMVFNGSNRLDTGELLLNVDKSFVLAVDYEFASGNADGATLMQCYHERSTKPEGFRLYYSSSNPTLLWNEASEVQCATGTNREMLVLRHVEGETGLHVYMSNLDNTEIGYVELAYDETPVVNFSLVFGCRKVGNSAYEHYAKGSIHWAKLWNADLGDAMCRDIASYTRENISTQMCGYRRKFIASEGSDQRCNLSFLATHILRNKQKMTYNSSSSNVGGWGASPAKDWLNNRFYNGLPLWMKQLIKLVSVKYSQGNKSTSVASCDCYIYLPAYAELFNDTTSSSIPYKNEEIVSPALIPYMENSNDRVRYDHLGNAVAYTTRSTSEYSTGDKYFYGVATSGNSTTTGLSSSAVGLVIEFCM